MSLTEPKYGDVFVWRQGAVGEQSIMYIVNARPDAVRAVWRGVTIRGAGAYIGTPGEVSARVPLTGHEWTHWQEAEPDA